MLECRNITEGPGLSFERVCLHETVHLNRKMDVSLTSTVRVLFAPRVFKFATIPFFAPERLSHGPTALSEPVFVALPSILVAVRIWFLASHNVLQTIPKLM